MAYADEVYFKNLKQIMRSSSSDMGYLVRPHWKDGTRAYTKSVFGLVNRYDVGREFPILTCRKINYEKAFDEALWIYQKASNNIHDLNSHIWDAWADETGSIGKAYGYQMSIKHHYPEGDFTQMERVLYDLSHDPTSRRIMTNLYNHHDLSEMALAPCAYSMTFYVDVNSGKLNMLLNQRSQDMIVANNWNVVQYAFLLVLIAKSCGYEAGELVHVVANAHIYDRHLGIARELLNRRESFEAPKIEVEDFIDFYLATPKSVVLKDYKYSDYAPKFEVAI